MPTAVLQKGTRGTLVFPKGRAEKNLTESPGQHLQTTHVQDVPSSADSAPPGVGARHE